MNGFPLDTNIPSEMLRPRPDANVAAWVKRRANETLFVSVVTMGELRRGVTLLAEQSPRRAELQRANTGVAAWEGKRPSGQRSANRGAVHIRERGRTRK